MSEPSGNQTYSAEFVHDLQHEVRTLNLAVTALGSLLGVTLMIILIGIVIFFCRKRQSSQSKAQDVASNFLPEKEKRKAEKQVTMTSQSSINPQLFQNGLDVNLQLSRRGPLKMPAPGGTKLLNKLS